MNLHQGERSCHKRLSVTAQHAASQSPLTNAFALTAERCSKRSHHPVSMERNLHHKVIPTHNKHLHMPNNRRLMPSRKYHPMLNPLNNKCQCIRNSPNSKVQSQKHLARLAFFSSCGASAGADMQGI